MENKSIVQSAVSNLGLTIGCWDDKLNLLTKKELKKVLDNIEYANDTSVSVKRKKHVVEIDIVDAEADFSVLTKDEYINRYGIYAYEDLN